MHEYIPDLFPFADWFSDALCGLEEGEMLQQMSLIIWISLVKRAIKWWTLREAIATIKV